MTITTSKGWLTVALPDGRSATVPFDKDSSLISRAGRAVVKVAESIAKAQPLPGEKP